MRTTVGARRRAVVEVQTAARVSERRACRFVGVARSSQRYVPQRDDTELRARLETLAMLKPRWGYRRLHWLLAREGWAVNRKRVQRVYRAAGLHVRRRRRKRVMRPRVVRPGPQRAAERWSIDFVHDTLGSGRVFRALTIVDDFTRYCPAIVVDYGLSGERVITTLDDARVTIERWRQEYNAGRPHSSLGDRTPEEFTRALAMTSSTLNPENWSE